MWTDYYLKFSSYEHYYQTMPENLQVEASHTHATDVIGTLYHHETFEPLQGFHVNLRLSEDTDLPAELQSFALPQPALPKRVFA
ncbi:MAG: hypothetical protein DI628_06025 [Blastochloris viridis]|uniref:Uncharacterized protein n=1 Tax=Blastochloris viridis TaxID=1079 RepID=A0A6N4RB22_BLAVI|nr:MAG: hypothetical protein DI628_06025 [Blastochloris viridis]